MSDIIRRIDNIVHGSKLDIEIDSRGLGCYIFDNMKRHESNIFQINATDGEEQKYDFVNQKCIRVALEMKKRGIKPHDVVLLCLSNSMDNVVPVISTLYLNAITVTLDPSISSRDTTHLLNIVRPKMIFVQENSTGLIESGLKDSNFETEIIVLGNHEKYSTYSEFLKEQIEEDTFVPDVVENVKDTAIIFFSSGTTGLPKAIELSHYAANYFTELTPKLGYDCSTLLFFTSYYWISALGLTIIMISKGYKKIVIKTFEPELALKTIDKYKVTNTFFAPSFSYTITDDLLKKYPCSNLRSLLFGGSSLKNEQMKKMRRYFPNCEIFLIYAQTECGGLIASFTSSNYREFLDKYGSSGQPTPNIQIKIIDFDTNEPLELYEKGEILVKTPSSCNGYYNQDSSGIYDKDGFVKTGDVGYFDEDNCLFVCDRIKDMFKFQSWHIVPLSLENVIAQHPSVAEVLVIGIPTETEDHIPMALIVLRKDSPTVNDDDLLKFANGKLSEREQLRGGLKIVKHLPKGPTGKVLRKNITDLVISGQLQKLLE